MGVGAGETDALALSQWLHVVLDAGRTMTYGELKVKQCVNMVVCPNMVTVV